ncbi:MAG: IS3 family transposase, partial [Bacteroidetes bacterium]|nr:IS3 family transposase [Bacteroidota bacterium]
MWYYKSQRDDEEVMTKLDELADRYPTRGFDQYYKHIRSEGLKWNRKRVLRVYRLMKLHLRRKRKKRRIPARV